MLDLINLILISINLIFNIFFMFLLLACSKVLMKLLNQNSSKDDVEIFENLSDDVGLVDITTPQTSYDPRFRN